MKTAIGWIVGIAAVSGIVLATAGSKDKEPDYYNSDDLGASVRKVDSTRTDDPATTRSYADYGDMDCGDFSSFREAQDFFESEGGPYEDYHNLDRDGDGLACESL